MREINELKNMIKELTSLCGVSGQEDDVIKYMYDKFIQMTEEVEVDNLGNIICHFPSKKSDASRIMIFAHMDEIGFAIKKVEKNGFLRFERIGGVNKHILPGAPIIISSDDGNKVSGIIGVKSHHFMKQEEKARIPDIESLYIDIGASSKKEVYERGIYEGSYATFKPNFLELTENIICSKAIDDRAACAVLIKLAERLVNLNESIESDIYIVASVQEEFNIRGIMPVVRKIKPDIAIGIDITPACDTPDLYMNSDISLNHGPAITYLNFHGRGTLAGLIPNKKLTKYMEKTAGEFKIPFQREVSIGVITETAFICLENEGIITGNISIPTRYSHTPIETVHLNDLHLTIELLWHIALGIKSINDFKKVGSSLR